ncbi:protein HIRA homolog [Episyrphus balteatus]|uniref:protein HIRA homolog n=1 Tax=Episyrphus balteatus TaxID=286459 RepID=UPI002486639D|nr:protein HIRA homolog [Episyrphus balteatus]
MKLVKPHWVHHDDKPIFSVDIHQECLKFATGGQGNDSGRVVIWNLLPILSEKAELDNSVPKILCQMDSHLSCVNCVRWSKNGQLLASGSDDKLVMLWKKAKGSSGVFGTGGITKNPESWKCIATLRGHSGDVLDLAWSPHDRWLASCSVDNSIIVWDAQAFPSMVAMLKGHTGLVKGVTWDPVGKFLASQSDDRSVKIWKTSDWTCSNTITEPFEECGGTTHILRLSWSPDGQYLVSAHAMNGGGPTAQIIEREGWKCDKDFVGHRKAVTCVRFHSSILKRQAPKTNKPQQYCCLAVGSRDRSLSVWMTALQRPLVVIHDLFEDSILDLSWGAEKCILLACSGDGTVACLQFSEKELGTSLSEEDKNLLYQRIYGKGTSFETTTSARDTLIENAELLNAVPEQVCPPSFPIDLNSETIKETTVRTMTSNSADTIYQAKAINKQTETRTADGKRRITPVFIPLNQEPGDVPVTVINSSSRPKNDAIIVAEKQFVSYADTSAMKPIITEAEQTRLDNRLTKSTLAISPSQASQTVLKSFPAVSSSSTSNTKPQISNGPVLHGHKNEVNKSAQDYRIHVQNSALTTSMGPLSKVICWAVNGNEKIWEIFIGSQVASSCLSSKYLIVCSVDGTLRILSLSTGNTVFPIINLASAAVQCAFCPLGNLVGVITECGLLRIWDIALKKIVISTTCAEIFGKHGQVVQFSITENGVPFVLFSNGNSYTYSSSMQCWMVLNSKDPAIRHGLRTAIPKDFQKNFRSYPLTTIQSSSNNYTPNASEMNKDDWQSGAKLLFIENQIKLCEVINSPKEMQHWYSSLAYHLATNGVEKQIRLLLDDLLGNNCAQSSEEDLHILGIPKKNILDTVLNVFKLHPKWQRLYMEYRELIDCKNDNINKLWN